jgi:hypothetical protein
MGATNRSLHHKTFSEYHWLLIFSEIGAMQHKNTCLIELLAFSFAAQFSGLGMRIFSLIQKVSLVFLCKRGTEDGGIRELGNQKFSDLTKKTIKANK